jgi:hypothetical protein
LGQDFDLVRVRSDQAHLCWLNSATRSATPKKAPHPAAPDTPPANKLLDAAAGLVDRLLDTFTGRGDH